jgi:predicted  nucleic acid-binding Zn-ribbon protein
VILKANPPWSTKRPRETTAADAKIPKYARKVLAVKKLASTSHPNEEVILRFLHCSSSMLYEYPSDYLSFLQEEHPEEEHEVTNISSGFQDRDADRISSSIPADSSALVISKNTERDAPAKPSWIPAGAFDPKNLLTFDPSNFIVDISETSREEAITTQLPSEIIHGLRTLVKTLETPAEKLVETSESIKEVLSTISADIPEDLQKVLAPISSLGLFRARVKTSVTRIKARQSQLPLRKTIANKCQQLNQQKLALGDTTIPSNLLSEIDTLKASKQNLEEKLKQIQQEIADVNNLLEKRNREFEQIGKNRETLAQAIQEWADVQQLSQHIIPGTDEEDQAVFAEIDRLCNNAITKI